MDMENSQIFELTRLGTFANPRIGARWATGLTPGLSPNTANETLVDPAGNSVEINLLPPVHFYTFPHMVLTHGLTRLLIVNRTAWKDKQDNRSGPTASAPSRPTNNQHGQTHEGRREATERSRRRSRSYRRSRERSRSQTRRDRYRDYSRPRDHAGTGAGAEARRSGESNTWRTWGEERKTRDIHDWSFTNDDGVLLKVDSKDGVKEKAATTRAIVRAMGKDKRRAVFSNLVLGMDKIWYMVVRASRDFGAATDVPAFPSMAELQGILGIQALESPAA